MSEIPDKELFAAMYADRAPWDIPGPQPAFVERADQVQGDILDAGCGTGENALFFAGRGHRVTGIDYLEQPILRARAKSAERSVQAEFLVKDALALSEWDRRFDSVIDSGLSHVFSDAERRTYESCLKHVVKPGGRVFLMCFSEAEPGEFGPRRVTKQELHDMFANGWSVDSIEPTRFSVIPEFQERFSQGMPHAWFAVMHRLA